MQQSFQVWTADAVAEYVSGEIRVFDASGSHTREESELITGHENFHHMLRQKSSFGLYLSALFASSLNSNQSTTSFALQALASRYRSSDETLATYASARMASWCYGAEPVQAILKRYPTYAEYYRLGESLTFEEALALPAATLVEAIVRFCWSPAELFDFSRASLDDLNSILPSNQFPDKRFERIRRSWSTNDCRELMAAMINGDSGLLDYLSQPYLSLIDPYFWIKQDATNNSALFIMAGDAQLERSNHMKENHAFLSKIAIELVWRGYEHLSVKFAQTDLKSLPRSTLQNLISQKTETRASDALNGIPETLYVRTTRRRFPPINQETFQPWSFTVNYGEESFPVAPVFIRPISKLEQHIDLSSLLVSQPSLDPLDNGRLAVYSLHPRSPVELSEISFAELNGWNEVEGFIRERKVVGPVVVWTSDLNMGVLPLLMVTRGLPVWLICDTEPILALEALRLFLGEHRGVICTSEYPGSSVTGLCLFRLQRRFVEGILFPGSITMTDPIVRLAFKVYGDDCRDINSEGPVLFVDQYVREKTGRALLNLISLTERWFSMSPEPSNEC